MRTKFVDAGQRADAFFVIRAISSSENCGFGGKNKTQSFQKLFVGGYLFVFVEYLCNCSPKIEIINMKTYSSILAIVNHRNWLDDSPPLIALLKPSAAYDFCGNCNVFLLEKKTSQLNYNKSESMFLHASVVYCLE